MRINRDDILAALIKIGVQCAGTFSDKLRLSRGDLATDLAEALNEAARVETERHPVQVWHYKEVNADDKAALEKAVAQMSDRTNIMAPASLWLDGGIVDRVTLHPPCSLEKATAFLENPPPAGSYGRFGPANVPYEQRPKGPAELAAEEAKGFQGHAGEPAAIDCLKAAIERAENDQSTVGDKIKRDMAYGLPGAVGVPGVEGPSDPSGPYTYGGHSKSAAKNAMEKMESFTGKTLIVNADPAGVEPSEADAMFKFFKGS